MPLLFVGGSPVRCDLMKMVHARGSDYARLSQRSITNGSPNYVSWFGTAIAGGVAQRYAEIVNYFEYAEWTFQLVELSAVQLQYGLACSVSHSASREGQFRITIDLWEGLFQQNHPQEAVRIGALSLLHCAAATYNSWSDFSFVTDEVAAKNLALLSPTQAAVSPRNYMGFASTISLPR